MPGSSRSEKGPDGSKHRGGQVLKLNKKSECDGHAILAALVPLLEARQPSWPEKRVDTYAQTILTRAIKAMDDGTCSKALRSKRREVSWHQQVIRASAEHLKQRPPGLREVATPNCIRGMLNDARENLKRVAWENRHTGQDYCRPPCCLWSKESRNEETRSDLGLFGGITVCVRRPP